MSHYYFDSSALVKRYLNETGTTWVRSLFGSSSNTVYTVRISGAEVVAAIFRSVRIGSIAASDADAAVVQFKADLSIRYQMVEVTEPIIDSAMLLAEKYGLRGYDSVQLAAALILQRLRMFLSLPPIIFVCADNKLNAAASAEGFMVENPNDH